MAQIKLAQTLAAGRAKIADALAATGHAVAHDDSDDD
jgi:hypothetical protein